MRDRQYLYSFAISVGVVAAALGGIVSLAFWPGQAVAVGLLAIMGGSLAWFYWGPRPDLRSKDPGDERDRPRNDA